MYSVDHLDLRGYHHESVPHTFFQQQDESTHVAVICAGRGVNCQHPTLYYPIQEMLARGADALLVDYCLRPAFSQLSEEEVLACVRADTLAAAQSLFGRKNYEHVTLIGKSLGTLAMGSLLPTIPSHLQVQAIWLTPLLTDPELETQIQQYHPRSLFILGTEDPYYHEDTLARWVKATQAETLVIPGAEHLLEVSEGTIASLHVMEQVIQAIQAFLSHKP